MASELIRAALDSRRFREIGALYFDEHGNLRSYNPAARKLLSFRSTSRAMGTHFENIHSISNSEHLIHLLRDGYSKDTPRKFLRYNSHDHTVREGPFVVSLVPLFDRLISTEDDPTVPKRDQFPRYAVYFTPLHGRYDVEAEKGITDTLDEVRRQSPLTYNHLVRTMVEADGIAEKIGFGAKFRRAVRYSALLHDIGKSIPSIAHAANKKGNLKKKEYELISEHCVEGSRLFNNLKFSDRHLHELIDSVILNHHGIRDFEDGLRLAERATKLLPNIAYALPLHLPVIRSLGPQRRVLHVVSAADIFDAMRTRYWRSVPLPSGERKPATHTMTHIDVLAEIRSLSGTQFHPQAVDALLKVWRPLLRADRERKKIIAQQDKRFLKI